MLRRGHVPSEYDRAPGTWWRELDHSEVFAAREVRVQPPPQPPVELLRPVDIRNRDHDHRKLRRHSRDAGVAIRCRGFSCWFGFRHYGTPSCGLKVGYTPQWSRIKATSLNGRNPPVRDEETNTLNLSGALNLAQTPFAASSF
jgi:hypothetical protein